MQQVEMRIDVADAVKFGAPAHTTATVFLPDFDRLAQPPIVCFAFPGGGYSRGYYSFDMPDGGGGGQAGWHVARGWIFVACDHLGVGESTVPEGNALSLENVALGNRATVEAVMAKLESGTLLDGYPAVRGAVKLGIGQSMGGCLTIILQGQHRTFDGIATLGYSAIHTVIPSKPGTSPSVWPWIPRSSSLDDPTLLNGAQLAAAAGPTIDNLESLATTAQAGEHPFSWAFHFDDEPAEVVAADMAATTSAGGELPLWRSATTPPCAMYMVAPGAVATEAAAITVPVLAAMGERDVIPDPWLESLAFKSSADFSLFVCPRMAHMHNFASTRQLFWQRIHSWGAGTAAQLALQID